MFKIDMNKVLKNIREERQNPYKNTSPKSNSENQEKLNPQEVSQKDNPVKQNPEKEEIKDQTDKTETKPVNQPNQPEERDKTEEKTEVAKAETTEKTETEQSSLKSSPFEKEKKTVYKPPYRNEICQPEKLREIINNQLFLDFRKTILNLIGEKNYYAVKKYKEESGLDLEVALVDRVTEFTPIHLFSLFKELADKYQIPRVIFVSKADEVEVRYVDGKVKFYLEGEEVIPIYSLFTLPQEVIKGEKTAVLLPVDQWKILQTEAEVRQETSGKDVVSFKDILKKALQMKASDIHIVPKERGFFTFFRINKQLVEIPEFFMSKDTWKSFARILFNEVAKHTVGNFRTDDFRVVNEGRIEYPDLRVSVRFEYIPDGHSLSYGEIICRVLKKEGISGRESLKERLLPLGYDEKDVEVFERLTLLEGGLIVISGKTNSGKSTLTANILASIPKYKKVGTIEDPIEYVQDNPNVVQHQVYLPPEEKDQLSPLEYVKAFKRADYDVVLVGEWRNYPGLTEAMVEQAQAGQLIFTTLHITSAYEIYEALHNIFRVPYEISAGLILFSFNQSLVPKLCPHCSESVEISFTEEELLMSRQLTKSDRERLTSLAPFEGRKRGKGCEKCNGTGVKGLVPIYEFLVPNEEIRNRIIREKAEFTPLMLKEYVEEKGLKEKGLAKFKVDTYLKALKEGLIEKEVIFTI